MRITILRATIRGLRPLVMHNGRLRDPLDPHSKALASAVRRAKTSKSEDDVLECQRVEFVGSLYFDAKHGPIIPADNLQAVVTEGARKRKLGKAVEALVQVLDPEDGALGYKLEYDGPRDPDGLYQSDKHRLIKSARVGQGSVMRARPRFRDWLLTFKLEITQGGPTTDQVREAIEDAGLLVGLGDWTPRYGRFELADLI